MYRKRKNMIKSIALCFLFTFMILSSNISSYAEEVTSHPVKVKQVIVVDSGYSKPRDVFHYTMKAEGSNTPLPEGRKDTYSFSIQGDGEKELGMTYDRAGDYIYTIYQNKDISIENCKQDCSIYRLHVRVIASQGGLSVYVWILDQAGYKREDMTFFNRYSLSRGATGEHSSANTSVANISRPLANTRGRVGKNLLPKTGYRENTMWYGCLLVLLGLAMLANNRMNSGCGYQKMRYCLIYKKRK